MEHSFIAVTDAAALDQLFARSHTASVVVFLHDPFCPISAAAYREMSQVADDVALIDVARAQDLSHLIEARTGVRHESPQVLVLRNGQAVWSASHHAITAEAVAEVVRTEGEGGGV